MKKTTTSLTLDYDVLSEVRKRNLNLSLLVNDFLKSYLDKEPDEEEKKYEYWEDQKLEEDINEVKMKLGRMQKMREANIKKKAEEIKRGRFIEA